MATIGIVGAGAWGTALAMTAARAGNNVLLWAREPEVVREINEQHVNDYLPGVEIDAGIIATGDLPATIAESDALLLVAPAQFTRSMMEQMKPYWRADLPLVLCAKGIELDSGLLLSEVVREVIPDVRLAVLSGPAFAAEVARNKPTAVTIGATEPGLASTLCQQLKSDCFRPYSTTDLITPQVCGSIKNVLAIASGIADGCRFGDNARAALITRGLSEMGRFAVALGGEKETVLGLCGIGDLTLTANSTQSRNYSFGFAVGQAGRAAPVLKTCTKTVEGVATASSVIKRAEQLGVEMPLCRAVNETIYHNKPIQTITEELLARPLKSEG